MTDAYAIAYRRSMEDPVSFWSEIAENTYWFKKWDTVLGNGRPPFYRWFVGGMVNTCYNALDLHVDQGRGRKVALIHDSPVTGTITKFTYLQLRELVARFAGVLIGQGVRKGDRVVIYMPMIPETAIAMLACARIGAIHSVAYGGLSAKELAGRIDDAQPKVVLSASCGIEGRQAVPYKPRLDTAIDIARHKPECCIIFQRPMAQASMKPGRDLDWKAAMHAADPIGCVPVAATDPLYMLYTPGTTGQPRGVVRDNGGHMVALKWSMQAIYGQDMDDVWWAASDLGWVAGHSYILYAPLLKGCTTVLYEGRPVGTPDAGAYWRVIAEHRVTALLTSPNTMRAIKREDPEGRLAKRHDLSSLKSVFLAGEHSDPDTILWSERHLKARIIDHWCQTESGWAIVANCMGLTPYPIKYGSPTKPVPGWDIKVLAENGQPAPAGQIGALVVKLPLPPGALPTLWQNDEQFVEAYMSRFPGYYDTTDAGYMDEEGYIYVMSRSDDMITVGGRALSTGAVEEILTGHPDVAEAAVIGVADQMRGQIPLGFLVLNAGVKRNQGKIVNEAIQMVEDRIGPWAVFKRATVVRRLPKTRSGHVLRGTIRKIADCEAYHVPDAIDDPLTLLEILSALQHMGYARPGMPLRKAG